MLKNISWLIVKFKERVDMVAPRHLFFFWLNACSNNSNRKDFSDETVNGRSGLRRSGKVLFLEYYFFSYLVLSCWFLEIIPFWLLFHDFTCGVAQMWGFREQVRASTRAAPCWAAVSTVRNFGNKFDFVFIWPRCYMWDLSSPCSGSVESWSLHC